MKDLEIFEYKVSFVFSLLLAFDIVSLKIELLNLKLFEHSFEDVDEDDKLAKTSSSSLLVSQHIFIGSNTMSPTTLVGLFKYDVWLVELEFEMLGFCEVLK